MPATRADRSLDTLADMEWSGWPDDDDSSPLPPRDQRAWRHPSELGRAAAVPTPGCERRRSTGRFAFAVAAGTAGTLAVASIAVVTFGSGHKQAAAPVSGIAISDSLGRVASSALTTLYSSGAVSSAEDQSAVPEVSTTLVARLSSTTIAPSVAPTVVALQRSDDSSRSVAAVIIDDGTVWAVAADVAGTDRLETTVAGDKVFLTVDVADPETGLVQLHPAKPLVLTPPTSVAWLGVNCNDEYVNRPPSTAPPRDSPQGARTTIDVATTLRPAAAVASPDGPTTVAAPATTVASQLPATTTTLAPATAVTHSAVTSLAPAERPDVQRPQPASRVDTASAAASTTISVGGSTADVSAPTTIVDDFTPVNSTPLDKPEATTSPPSTASSVVWPQGDAAAAGSHMRGVHVRDVVRASPADKGGVRRGDVILSADGRPVRTIWALVLAVRRHAIGDEISVLVRRDGNLVELKMNLGSRPDGST